MVIGSGIGGLCCAGLLARYEQDVLLFESHDLPGGAAHSFEIKGYKFDSGPSLFSGFQSRGPQANPLAQVISYLFPLFIRFLSMILIYEGELQNYYCMYVLYVSRRILYVLEILLCSLSHFGIGNLFYCFKLSN